MLLSVVSIEYTTPQQAARYSCKHLIVRPFYSIGSGFAENLAGIDRLPQRLIHH